MSKFQIVQNISRKGQMVKTKKVTKSINYLAIPFKDMSIGDCIILKERDEKKINIASTKATVKQGVSRALTLLNLDPSHFIVDWTGDKKKVGVWRVK